MHQFRIRPARHAMPVLALAALALVAAASINGAAAQATTPDYAEWPLLTPEFPSTGGGGVVIRGYAPIVSNGKCRTDFQAVMPDGAVYPNEVEFDAVATAGGTLCANGKWRSKDGSATGTTPFEVFIRDGVSRMKP